jgi:nickel/cobalt transporter (NicO) family protein
MVSFTELFQQGAASAWLFLPTAVLLGALHGLEPGHSKTMMAAFIVAVQGTVPQAILLGASAAFSHVVIIWVLAVAALHWGSDVVSEEKEPLFMVVSGLIIVALALWMLVRARRDIGAAKADAQRKAHSHVHNHHNHHSHGAGDGDDAHQRYHTRQIAARFANGRVTTGQIVLFGLTGGLLPCSAAVAVLLICLQFDHYALGLATVGAFSVGLAIALIGVGAIAAWGVGQASRRFDRVYDLARRLPYLSSMLVLGIGVLMTVIGWWGLRI